MEHAYAVNLMGLFLERCEDLNSLSLAGVLCYGTVGQKLKVGG